MDGAICQMKPAYIGLLARYYHTLSQRGTLCSKIFPAIPELIDTLEIWEESSRATAGPSRPNEVRQGLSKCAEERYNGISGERKPSGPNTRPII